MAMATSTSPPLFFYFVGSCEQHLCSTFLCSSHSFIALKIYIQVVLLRLLVHSLPLKDKVHFIYSLGMSGRDVRDSDVYYCFRYLASGKCQKASGYIIIGIWEEPSQEQEQIRGKREPEKYPRGRLRNKEQMAFWTKNSKEQGKLVICEHAVTRPRPFKI